MFPKGYTSRKAARPGKDNMNTRRRRRPNPYNGFFDGWDFKSWGEAIVTLALIVVVCAGIVGFLVWAFIAADKAAYEYTETTICWVEQGDTLWKIARDYSTEKQDVRRVIDIIEKMNDCGATIYPGQCLIVPVFYK